MTHHPFRRWSEIGTELRRLFEAADGRPDLAEQIVAHSQTIVELAEALPDTALATVIRLGADHYASAHSLHVAILATLLGRRLQWSADARRTVVRSALSMNLAMVALQMRLQDQKEPVSEAQQREIASHPQRACKMLLACGVTEHDWIEAVRLHHERFAVDGSHACPDGRALSQMLRLLDVFCARISHRGYRRALMPAHAARELMGSEGRLCGAFVAVLIEEIGLHFPGSFVGLENGEVAMVLRRQEHTPMPVVVTLPDGAIRHTDAAGLSIRIALPDDAVALPSDLGEFWDQLSAKC